MSPKTKQAADPIAEAVDQATVRFYEVIEQALRHFHDPVWLGQHSPVTSPYFLGDRLAKLSSIDSADNLERGQSLQQLLMEAADGLAVQHVRWGKLWHDLLQESYFSPANLPVYQIIHKLHTSEAAYHRHRKAAIHHLAQEVIRRVKPALRLESVSPPTVLVGRDAELTRLLAYLREHKSVGISGPGGVGKTTLGQALVQRFASNATFWYTFTPGLNDRIHSLLFALAYFLHGQEVSTLWSQLVAERGEIKESVAFNLLRYDLANLGERRVLLCFDEVDLLRPSEIEAHTQLIPFLESLRGLVPLLCIGQKLLIETDTHCPLAGLTLSATAHLCQEAAISLEESTLTHLHTYTQGNPRLLELFIALVYSLQRSGESTLSAIENALTSFIREPSLEFLLRRIWRHLNESEMYLLELLSVFRNAAPRSAWNDQAQQAALDQLITWHFVQIDERDGIRLLPAFRDAIYQNLLPSEEKELLHLEAGSLRAQYGQFTAAAHHYAAGGESTIAVDLLYTHKEQEIDQGQAEAALMVLNNISPRKLTKEVQEKYTLLRAELQKLLGHYDAARSMLQSVYWSKPFLAAQRWRLEGDIGELRGEVTLAQNAYQAGLELVEKLLGEAAFFHRDLGYLYTNDIELERARREVWRIRHEAANLEGFICENHGDLSGAAAAYQLAFQLAQTAQYIYGEANTHNNLGRMCAWQRQLTAAEEHLQAAITFFRNTGRLNKLASATYNLALARRLAKEYASALAPAEDALSWFVQLGEEYGRAVTFELLAEIQLGLGDLSQAEHYARRVIEEEHTMTLPDGLRTLGEVRLAQGNLVEAEQLIRQSLTLAQTNQNRIFEAYAWRSLSEFYVAHADLPAAEASVAQAVQIFRELAMEAEIEQCQSIAGLRQVIHPVG
jgi:hypothetical protein